MMVKTDEQKSLARCTLSPEALADRVIELRSEFFPLVARVLETDEGCLLEFPREPGMIERLAEFVAFESECCGFRSYAVEVRSGHDHVDLRVTGPPGSADAILKAVAAVAGTAPSPADAPAETVIPSVGGC